MSISSSATQKINELKKLYATAQGCIMPALTLVAEQDGPINNERLNGIAQLLGVPLYQVAETLTFYTMFNRHGRGRKHLQLCRNISCYVRGSDAVIEQAKQRLGLLPGERSADGEYELEITECLGDCNHAPCGLLGKEPIRDLTPEKINQLLDQMGVKNGL